MPRQSARLHLLVIIAAALLPVWLFAAWLLSQYAFHERDRFEREAVQVARQVSLVVRGELANLVTLLEGLAKSRALAALDFAALHAEASRLAEGTDRIILLRDFGRRQFLNTQLPFEAALPPAIPLAPQDIARFDENRPVIGEVYASPVSGEYRVPVALPISGPQGQRWLLAVTVPTSRIRDVMAPAVPQGWTVGVGDRKGAYVARSLLHDEMTGQPGLPDYVEQVVGRFGTFTASSPQGTTLLAGYWRSDFSDWFFTANIPLSVVRAPLWRSLAAIGAIGLVAMLLSAGLAYIAGKGFARAAAGLSARAEELGHGRPVAPMSTSVSEFAVIAEALMSAERTLADRAHEMETVLETVPAAVWFTYDPQARQVIRNRFAAELMGLPADPRQSGAPGAVLDTIARKDGQVVGREDRPLTRAMRGEKTDNQEFAYTVLDGSERILLTSARPIHDAAGRIVGAVQISLDITERKRGEEQRTLLVNELNHRVKNTLAVVQSIAHQTLRSAKTLPEAGHALSGRLVSLGKAHDILTEEQWRGADLRDLLAAALATHAGLDRFRLAGGSVWLRPTLALSLALAVHELATNAIKYGALSAAGGQVSISWTVDGQAEGRRLRIEWRETGGPPVKPAGRKGFGTRMLERILDSEPGGSVRIGFDPAGLACVFEADL